MTRGRFVAVGFLAVALTQLAVVIGVWVAAEQAWEHIALVVAPILGAVVGGVLGLARLGGASRAWAAVLALVCAAGGASAGLFAPSFLRPMFNPRYDGIAVGDAPRYGHAGVVVFDDGRVAADAGHGEAFRTGIGRRGYATYEYFVAPIVPADWTPDQPVPAWAASERRDEPAWQKPYRAGVALGPVERARYRQAMTTCSGLTSAEGAPILRWVSSPRAVLVRLGGMAGAAVGGPYLGWLVLAGAWWRRRGARAAGDGLS